MNGRRHSSCNSFYEDFEKQELVQPCPVCFYCGSTILVGSHPRNLSLIFSGNFVKIIEQVKFGIKNKNFINYY